ncbi:CaiB/BaiF CoA transferase family protein [Gordonia sp. (in: high G+C Gram-positive bacteria)]|uniref:CaiB/BaiF CoA transferase family protein n=1 Tax=Gordonia sp. (in: high G+C Gram-positive bacteria) TaxID=84139 RepID=UPI0039E468E1
MTDQPLHGIRILEIGGYISLPFATSLLCSLGAEVVKVEKPISGDDFRRHDNEEGFYFRQFNSGKRSLSMDLKRPEAIEVLKALIPHYDVVLENLRPGKLDAMGLSEAEIRRINPGIVFGQVNGFGDTGPLANRPAYDTIGHAYGGLYSQFGDEGHPTLAGGLSADQVSGLVTACGVLAALVGKMKTGRGQSMQTSILEAVTTLTTDSITQYFDTGKNPHRTSRHPQAQNFCVETASGEFVAMHLSSSQKFFEALCRAMDRPALAVDERFTPYRHREANYAALAGEVAAVFRTQPMSHWVQVLTREDVPFAPVLRMSDFVDNEQVKHLELLEDKKDGLQLVRPPWRFDGSRPHRDPHTPRVGEDSREVVAQAVPAERIDELVAAGVIYVDPEHDTPKEKK